MVANDLKTGNKDSTISMGSQNKNQVVPGRRRFNLCSDEGSSDSDDLEDFLDL